MIKVLVFRVDSRKASVVVTFGVDGFVSVRFADVDIDECCLDLLIHVDEVHSRRLVVQSGDGMSMHTHHVVRSLFDCLVGWLHYINLFSYTTARCVGKSVGA